MGTQIHKGAWIDCKVCPHTPEELKMKREKRERFVRKTRRSATNLDAVVRRQVAFELGADAEPTKDEKYTMLQKYGVVAARIDRKVSRPLWMNETSFNQKRNQWFLATKNLIPPQQTRRAYGNSAQQYPRPNGKNIRTFGSSRPRP